MIEYLKGAVLSALFLCAGAHAELPADYKVVLLTDNFPPFNMSVEGKNFARDAGISGISADIVRETFRRAGIPYSLTLRFPWDRLLAQAEKTPNYGIFTTTYTEERKDRFKWVGPLAKTSWTLMAAPGSALRLERLQDAAQYRVGSFKNNAISNYLASQGLAPINALSDQVNVDKLVKGQIDLWATDDPSGRYIAKLQGVSGLSVALRFNEAQMYLALAEGVG